MNSTSVYNSRLTWSNSAAGTKKKITIITKHDFQNVDAQGGIQTSTKGTFGKRVLRFPDAFVFLSFFLAEKFD